MKGLNILGIVGWGGVLNGGADSDAHESEKPERLDVRPDKSFRRVNLVLGTYISMASISNDSNGGNAGPQEEDRNHQIVVIDNGAYTVKGRLCRARRSKGSPSELHCETEAWRQCICWRRDRKVLDDWRHVAINFPKALRTWVSERLGN